MWISAPKEKSSVFSLPKNPPVSVFSLTSSSIFSRWRPLSNAHIFNRKFSHSTNNMESQFPPLFCHNFQLTYQCSFTIFRTHFIVNFQPWKKLPFTAIILVCPPQNSVFKNSPFTRNYHQRNSPYETIYSVIFRDSSMEIYKFKAIISIKPL